MMANAQAHPTTSLQVAEKFNNRHDDVLKAIRNMECPPEFHLRNFVEASYEVVQPNGGVASYRSYNITRYRS